MTSPRLLRLFKTRRDLNQVTDANVIQIPLRCDQDAQRALSIAYRAVSADWSGQSVFTGNPWPYEKGAEPPKFLTKKDKGNE